MVGLLAVILVSCDGPSGTGEPSTEEQEPSIPEIGVLSFPTDDSVADLVEGSKEVRFEGGSGDVLEGRLFGDGDVGVVLAHGYNPVAGQYDWFPVASALAAEGYSALTFNFTGFCPAAQGVKALGCSKGKEEATETWRDIEPAVAFLRDSGVDVVYAIGSSMGGMAVLNSASRTDVDVAGVLTMGSPRKAPPGFPSTMDVTDQIVRGVDQPKFIMAGKRDPGIAGGARAMFKVASQPKEIAILDTPAHGSDMIVRAPAEISTEAMTMLLGFIGGNVPG
jgi:predicted alpha/beta-hydrolase family hydrolase